MYKRQSSEEEEEKSEKSEKMMSTKCDRTRQLWVEGEPPKVSAKLKRGVSGAPKSLPKFAPPKCKRDRMERVRLAIAVSTRSARGPATSWAEVLVKNVHANLPKQWKAEIIFYEDGGDVEDEEDEKEDDGEVDESGKREREKESRRTRRTCLLYTSPSPRD